MSRDRESLQHACDVANPALAEMQARIATLTAELQKEKDRRVELRQSNQDLNESLQSVEKDWRTEKAAREAAVKNIADLTEDYGDLLIVSNGYESECATLRARVAELEAENQHVAGSCVAECEAKIAAESALASARREYNAGPEDTRLNRIGAALASHPEPAPVAGRAHCREHAGWRSDCEACSAPVASPEREYTWDGYALPMAAPVAAQPKPHPRNGLGPCPCGDQWRSGHPFGWCAEFAPVYRVAPVAAPCAGCAELKASADRLQRLLDICNDVHGHNVKLVAERKALREAIDAAIAELDEFLSASRTGTDQYVERALSALRAARGGS